MKLAPTRPNGGFTLIELLIVLAMLGILSALAMPSLNALLANNEINSTAARLHTSLQMARSYAIMNQHKVIVCQATDPSLSDCADEHPYNVNWSHGWLIYQDLNDDNNLDSNDQILQVFKNTGVAVVFNQRGRLRFFPDGSSRSAGFYVCSKRTQRMRHLFLLYSGRSRVSSDMSEKQRKICLDRAT